MSDSLPAVSPPISIHVFVGGGRACELCGHSKSSQYHILTPEGARELQVSVRPTPDEIARFFAMMEQPTPEHMLVRRNSDAVEDMDKNEQPTEEHRKAYYPNGETAEIRSRYDALIDVTKCKFEYVPIPKEVLHIPSREAWLAPTPSPVQRVIEVLSECWHYVQQLGHMPFYKEPEDMDDSQVSHLIRELDWVLKDEFSAWATAAGFTEPPQFFERTTVEDRRTIAAMLQKVVHETNLHDIMYTEPLNPLEG